MIELHTERLRLRALAETDRAAILDMISDWDVVRNLARWPYPARPEMVDDLLRRNREEPERGFGIEMGGRFAGTIGTGPSIGFMLARGFWGQGVMTEALGAVQRHALDVLGHEALTGNVLIDNPASARVFEKCGWREVGRETCFSAARGEAVKDRIFSYCDRPDWAAPITTERLVLRPLGPQDFDAIWPIVSDFETVRMLLSWPWPADEEYTRSRLGNAQSRAGLVSAITMDGTTLGMIGCTKGSLWYVISRSARGQGIATEAARGKITRAFENPGVDRLIAGTWDDNPASARILERLGFTQTGYDTMFHEARGEDASGPDYELTRTAWEALH